MKQKNNIGIFVLTSALCVLPVIFSLVVYKDLPDQIAVQWNIAGNPNNSLPKEVVAFGLPLLLLAINIYSKMRLNNDPKRPNNGHSQAVKIIAAWIPPLLSLVFVPIILCIATGADIPISVIAPIVVGTVFIICGNYLPKCRQNYTIGIKLPWTLHDANNWNKTHRMAGWLWILGGIALIIGTLTSINNIFGGIPMTILILILLVILPIGYSFLLYKKMTTKIKIPKIKNK